MSLSKGMPSSMEYGVLSLNCAVSIYFHICIFSIGTCHILSRVCSLVLLQKTEERRWGAAYTVVLIQLSWPWLTGFFAIHVYFEDHSAVVYTQWEQESSFSGGLVLMLMLVQCLCNSGLKMNSATTPQQGGWLKGQNFMGWPKLSSEAIFGFVVCGLGGAYSWVDLGMDNFAASYNSPCFQQSTTGNVKVYIQVFRNYFFFF